MPTRSGLRFGPDLVQEGVSWRRAADRHHPVTGPLETSRSAALSLTERVIECSVASPNSVSPACGAAEIRPRVGFKPYTPQHDAGIRIEPAPSLAPPTATIRAATAAAEPPLEPPVVSAVDHGLRHEPCTTGSVVE